MVFLLPALLKRARLHAKGAIYHPNVKFSGGAARDSRLARTIDRLARTIDFHPLRENAVFNFR